MINDYLNAVRKRLTSLPAEDRTNALQEIEAHLEADIGRRMAEGQDRTSATAGAIEAFGEPDEIAVAYDAGETVLRDATGDVLLRIARRTGQVAAGTGRVAAKGAWGFAKILGIVLLVAVAVATILGVGALIFAGNVLTAYQEDIVEAVPRPVYHYDEDFSDTLGTTDTWEDVFQIGPDTKEFRTESYTAPESGCARIELISPSGEVISMTNQNCSSIRKSTTLAEQGTWKVRYTLTTYTGDLRVYVESYKHA